MKTINYNDLENITYSTFGSFSSIYKCTFNNEKYILKEYINCYLDNDKKRKFNKLNKNIINKKLLLPIYLVKKDGKCNAVLVKQSPLKPIYSFSKIPIESKIKILKNAKKMIELMHSEKIVHADLHEGNILTDDKTFDINIIDFDNVSYNNSKIILKDTNDYSKEFIKKYGLSKDIDIFIFNLVTFELINNIGFYSVRNEIRKNNYGLFNNINESIKICNSMLLDNEIFNNSYLIDTIDESLTKK